MLIDWFTVGAQIVNFLVLVWLLKRFLYKPVLAAIAAREKEIVVKISEAETKKSEALKEEKHFRDKNEEFDRHRAASLLDVANDVKTERSRLLNAARLDAEALRVKLQKTLDGERDGLNAKILDLVQKEVFSIARKALVDLADANLEEKITGVFIRRLHDMNGEYQAILQSQSQPVLIVSAFPLSADQKSAIQAAMKSLLGEGRAMTFVTKPNLIGGIELVVGGHKIAWSIADYLATLTATVNEALTQKSDTPVIAETALLHAA